MMLSRAVRYDCNLTYNFCYKIKCYESEDELQGVKKKKNMEVIV